MSFSEEKVQSFISKIEDEQAKYRKRSIVAVIFPTVAAVLYLGITLWLINVKQNQLKIVENTLVTRKKTLIETEQQLMKKTQELRQVENAFTEQNSQVKQAQQEKAKGNVEAALNQISNINTDFRDQERAGFDAILKGDLEQARSLFESAYQAYPTYHNVDEIYNRVLTQNLIKTYNSASPSEKQSIQYEVMQKIVTSYSWGMPKDLLNDMKSILTTPVK